jgi:hypothetical protein
VTDLNEFISVKPVQGLNLNLWSILGLEPEPYFHWPYVGTWGYAVAQLVEALRYKPEGRRFDSRWCHSGLTMAGSTQPLTEMSTRNIAWG